MNIQIRRDRGQPNGCIYIHRYLPVVGRVWSKTFVFLHTMQEYLTGNPWQGKILLSFAGSCSLLPTCGLLAGRLEPIVSLLSWRPGFDMSCVLNELTKSTHVMDYPPRSLRCRRVVQRPHVNPLSCFPWFWRRKSLSFALGSVPLLQSLNHIALGSSNRDPSQDFAYPTDVKLHAISISGI